ncbi:MAG TPA: Ig-like domain-containing protein [Burkholderiaceae bacterium]
MAFISGKFSTSKILTAGLGLCAALLLASCGGGGGSAGTNGTSGSSGSTTTTTLSLVSPTTTTTPLAAYGSTTITVQVSSNGAAGGSGVTVNFASPCATSGSATLASSAVTDASGKATVSYTDKGCGTSDIITISSSGATSITETIQDAVPTAASISFVSASPSTDSIVIAGSGGNGRLETATLTFKVLDTAGNPLRNQKVTFSVNSTKTVSLGTTSAVSDATGVVVATVSSGSEPTTFRVIASLASGQSTESDTITVTTGQSSADALSISVEQFNIEGWQYDNITTNINILLADSFGNPVADGTPIVLETDSGAVGTSTNGGCTTANGACTVPFRSQNPRYGAGALPVPANKRAGVATVAVSTTNSTQTISGGTAIFLSGSFVENPIISYGGNTYTPVQSNGIFSVTLPASCAYTSFVIQLNDINNNPLPVATTITAGTTVGTTIAVGKIFPAAIQNVVPDTTNLTNTQGSIHTVSYAQPSSCTVTATNPTPIPGTGELDLTVTTPKSNTSLIQVKFQ